MNNIKNFDEFCNEEINLKKALTGAALASSLIFSTPQKTEASPQTKMELQDIQSQETLFTKQVTVSGPQQEVFNKVVQKLRSMNGRVSIFNQNKVVCSFTFQDVKPENSNGFTNISMDIDIKGNVVTLNFKKADFFYSGTQPQTQQDRFVKNIKSASIDKLTGVTRQVSPSQVLANKVGQELQKTKSSLYKPETNFDYKTALGSRDKDHQSFLESLDYKVTQIVNSLK